MNLKFEIPRSKNQQTLFPSHKNQQITKTTDPDLNILSQYLLTTEPLKKQKGFRKF